MQIFSVQHKVIHNTYLARDLLLLLLKITFTRLPSLTTSHKCDIVVVVLKCYCCVILIFFLNSYQGFIYLLLAIAITFSDYVKSSNWTIEMLRQSYNQNIGI